MSAVAETIPTQMPDPFVFTDSAAGKVAELIAEEGNPDLKLRVFVQGGGCSGFSYGFTFDEVTNVLAPHKKPPLRRFFIARCSSSRIGCAQHSKPSSPCHAGQVAGHAQGGLSGQPSKSRSFDL